MKPPKIKRTIKCKKCGDIFVPTGNAKYHKWCGSLVRDEQHNAYQRSKILEKRERI